MKPEVTCLHSLPGEPAGKQRVRRNVFGRKNERDIEIRADRGGGTHFLKGEVLDAQYPRGAAYVAEIGSGQLIRGRPSSQNSRTRIAHRETLRGVTVEKHLRAVRQTILEVKAVRRSQNQ